MICKHCAKPHDRPSNFCSYECFEIWYQIFTLNIISDFELLRREVNASKLIKD